MADRGGAGGGGYRWAQPGDVSAFLGLMFDNVAQLIVFSTILIQTFGYPAEIVLTKMLPGTAFGVMFGDLVYTWLAFRLARRTGRDDVTAMPLGIDTVSLFGLTFGALGPVFLQTRDPMLAWQVGMALMVMMGIFKIAITHMAARLRDFVPPAAMLGTIGAIGVALIAFMPLPKLFAAPPIGIFSLFLLLLVLLRRIELPGRIPPVLGVVALSTMAHYLLVGAGVVVPGDETLEAANAPLGVTWPLPTLGFLSGMEVALDYLPLALPLAFATIIGGIDNTESAHAVGDPYDTRSILLTEGFSTLAAGLVGGVIQTTPYIGHPAYKRMGGRAAYTLATALFVGLGGIFGYLSWLVHALPEVVVVPILVYIGLEIGGHAFIAVPRRHVAAVAVCFLPVLADVIVILTGQFVSGAGVSTADITGSAGPVWKAIELLAAGFVVSAMLFGSATAFIIDGRFSAAALTFQIAAIASLFGVIHSPLPGGATFLPWRLDDPTPWYLAAGYAATGLLVWAAALLPSADLEEAP
jgi:AGZA family xanthine/uracil permease-like MFS transporter